MIEKKKDFYILKRNNDLVKFNPKKIKKAILLAMEKTNTVNVLKADTITENISQEIYSKGVHYNYNVEDIQDMVIKQLAENNCPETLVEYVTYREKKSKERQLREKYLANVDINSNEFEKFVKEYKKKEAPFSDIGRFVYYRTYSRFIEELGRREFWYETVKRAVDYNTSILPTSEEEKEQLYDNIFNLKQFLSGRTLWTGGTKASLKYPTSNFNCAFITIDSFEKFSELFFCLMLGCGVGIRVLPEDTAKLPPIRSNFILINETYNEIPKSKRSEYTDLSFIGDNTALITIGDSKEGWIQSIYLFFKLITEPLYDNIKTIRINYDNIRPAGEKLATFGGTASGYMSMLNMFNNINKILHNELDPELEEISNGQLRGIHALDIATSIANNVVVGGVRRSSMICLFSPEDKEILRCKDFEKISKYSLYNRYMSNNSIIFEEKPSLEKLKEIIESIKNSSEPGFINITEARRRRNDCKGLNPCAEILLNDRGLCNLTTVNVKFFLNEDFKLDLDSLINAQKLSARAGYRMGNLKLSDNRYWEQERKKKIVIGCSLTGWQDMINSYTGFLNQTEDKLLIDIIKENYPDDFENLKSSRTYLNLYDNIDITEAYWDENNEKVLLLFLKYIAKKAINDYIEELKNNGYQEELLTPELVTTVKPEGTISLMPFSSPGIHYPYSSYFIRRVRINRHDPLCKVVEKLNYPLHNEVGQEDDKKCTTKVIDFYCKTDSNKTIENVGVIEQLENYKKFMQFYVDHNASNTITIKEDKEWDLIPEWIFNNWNYFVGISFAKQAIGYKLAPYEKITKEVYEENKKIKKFDPYMIQKYEIVSTNDDEGLLDLEECTSGSCPIR